MTQPRDKNGRFLSNKTKPSKKAKSPKKVPVTQAANPVGQTPTKKMINRIALVLDASGSMSHLIDKVIEQTNEQMANIKTKATEAGQDTRISLYTFDSGHVRKLSDQVYFQSAPMINRSQYRAGGGTNLTQAVTQVVHDLSLLDDPTQDVSFLVVTLTDGYENQSPPSITAAFPSLLSQKQGTDKWSFAFLCPANGVHILQGYGVPAGNIQPWEQTTKGVEVANMHLSGGIGNYYSTRASGQAATKNFFTDLSKVTQQDLNKLSDLSQQFMQWSVDKETDISTFVNEKLASKTLASKVGATKYTPGAAFYELTKPEKVQAYKGLCVQDKSTKKIYGGAEARKLLGLPENQDCKVTPLNHASFRVFVTSTSTNRKLVRGTVMLYKKA